MILIDFIAGLLLRKLYFQQKAGPNQALTYSFRNCDSNIIIFGASQAQHNYDTRIISDSMKMSCFNAGQDGGHSILMQYAQIKVITNRHIPKIIILDINPAKITYSSEAYDKLAILLPYFVNYPELRQIVLLKSQFEYIKLLSSTYPFNSNIINIIRYNTSTHSARKKDFNGYIPIKNKQMNLSAIKSGLKNDNPSIIDTNMVNALKDIIRICNDKKINLIIINSPTFHKVNENQVVHSPEAKLSLGIIHEGNIPYIDFTNDTLFKGRLDLFADQNHLNEKGATLFSNLLIQKLKLNGRIDL